MKITDIQVHLMAPFGGEIIAHTGSKVGLVFVEVSTDEGITGIGECSNWPRKGDVIAGRILHEIKDDLIGRDPEHIEDIWNQIFRNYTYLGNKGPITTVLSGINIALWDIKGKALRRPVYELLGGPVRDHILLYSQPFYWGDAEKVASSSKDLVAQGFTGLKTDPYQETLPTHTRYIDGGLSKTGARAGAEIIAAMREAVGPDIEIIIDLHGSYNVASAMRAIDAIAEYDITWFEEPFPPEGLDALRMLRRQTHEALSTGERLYTRWDFLPILQEGLTNYVMPDVCWTGGISELRKIASIAQAYFVPIAPHGALGPIQALASAHTMMTAPNFFRLEFFSKWMDLYDRLIEPKLDVREGKLFLPEGPGLGVEVDLEFVKAHPDPDWA